MAYTPPASTAVDFDLAPGYTPPTSAAVDFELAPSAPGGVTGAGYARLPVTVAGVGMHTDPIAPVIGEGVAVIPLTVAGLAAHGVTGVGSAAFGLAVAGVGAHGVTGAGAVALGISVAGAGAHGVAGTGAAVVPITVVGSAVHQRYELRGEVRLGGVLVNRRVRAYSRDTGVLLGEADTIAGKFRVHAGFAEIECYATPIDLSPGAVDWLPPTANRILSVLASDTA